ncbi:hypothetical protein CYMTET_50628 [Cymbomonas tetramitiformis]|uniref:Uncharacterized protein n=1 Tax=Cymbomonas tetramitiformis TaxID=36881 RepID=A0AAE0ETJ1_9CHLO|nr:hypothetical protein CYMTET_50628 [Cymbomonas tetramitiformis]
MPAVANEKAGWSRKPIGCFWSPLAYALRRAETAPFTPHAPAGSQSDSTVERRGVAPARSCLHHTPGLTAACLTRAWADRKDFLPGREAHQEFEEKLEKEKEKLYFRNSQVFRLTKLLGEVAKLDPTVQAGMSEESFDELLEVGDEQCAPPTPEELRRPGDFVVELTIMKSMVHAAELKAGNAEALVERATKDTKAQLRATQQKLGDTNQIVYSLKEEMVEANCQFVMNRCWKRCAVRQQTTFPLSSPSTAQSRLSPDHQGIECPLCRRQKWLRPGVSVIGCVMDLERELMQSWEEGAGLGGRGAGFRGKRGPGFGGEEGRMASKAHASELRSKEKQLSSLQHDMDQITDRYESRIQEMQSAVSAARKANKEQQRKIEELTAFAADVAKQFMHSFQLMLDQDATRGMDIELHRKIQGDMRGKLIGRIVYSHDSTRALISQSDQAQRKAEEERSLLESQHERLLNEKNFLEDVCAALCDGLMKAQSIQEGTENIVQQTMEMLAASKAVEGMTMEIPARHRPGLEGTLSSQQLPQLMRALKSRRTAADLHSPRQMPGLLEEGAAQAAPEGDGKQPPEPVNEVLATVAALCTATAHQEAIQESARERDELREDLENKQEALDMIRSGRGKGKRDLVKMTPMAEAVIDEFDFSSLQQDMLLTALHVKLLEGVAMWRKVEALVVVEAQDVDALCHTMQSLPKGCRALSMKSTSTIWDGSGRELADQAIVDMAADAVKDHHRLLGLMKDAIMAASEGSEPPASLSKAMRHMLHRGGEDDLYVQDRPVTAQRHELDEMCKFVVNECDEVAKLLDRVVAGGAQLKAASVKVTEMCFGFRADKSNRVAGEALLTQLRKTRLIALKVVEAEDNLSRATATYRAEVIDVMQHQRAAIYSRLEGMDQEMLLEEYALRQQCAEWLKISEVLLQSYVSEAQLMDAADDLATAQRTLRWLQDFTARAVRAKEVFSEKLLEAETDVAAEACRATRDLATSLVPQAETFTLSMQPKADAAAVAASQLLQEHQALMHEALHRCQQAQDDFAREDDEKENAEKKASMEKLRGTLWTVRCQLAERQGKDNVSAWQISVEDKRWNDGLADLDLFVVPPFQGIFEHVEVMQARCEEFAAVSETLRLARKLRALRQTEEEAAAEVVKSTGALQMCESQLEDLPVQVSEKREMLEAEHRELVQHKAHVDTVAKAAVQVRQEAEDAVHEAHKSVAAAGEQILSAMERAACLTLEAVHHESLEQMRLLEREVDRSMVLQSASPSSAKKVQAISNKINGSLLHLKGIIDTCTDFTEKTKRSPNKRQERKIVPGPGILSKTAAAVKEIVKQRSVIKEEMLATLNPRPEPEQVTEQEAAEDAEEDAGFAELQKEPAAQQEAAAPRPDLQTAGSLQSEAESYSHSFSPEEGTARNIAIDVPDDGDEWSPATSMMSPRPVKSTELSPAAGLVLHTIQRLVPSIKATNPVEGGPKLQALQQAALASALIPYLSHVEIDCVLMLVRRLLEEMGDSRHIAQYFPTPEPVEEAEETAEEGTTQPDQDAEGASKEADQEGEHQESQQGGMEEDDGEEARVATRLVRELRGALEAHRKASGSVPLQLAFVQSGLDAYTEACMKMVEAVKAQVPETPEVLPRAPSELDRYGSHRDAVMPSPRQKRMIQKDGRHVSGGSSPSESDFSQWFDGTEDLPESVPDAPQEGEGAVSSIPIDLPEEPPASKPAPRASAPPPMPGYWDGRAWTHPEVPTNQRVSLEGNLEITVPRATGTWAVKENGYDIIVKDLLQSGRDFPGLYIPPAKQDKATAPHLCSVGYGPMGDYGTVGSWGEETGVLDWLAAKLQLPKEVLLTHTVDLNLNKLQSDTEGVYLPRHLFELMQKSEKINSAPSPRSIKFKQPVDIHWQN